MSDIIEISYRAIKAFMPQLNASDRAAVLPYLRGLGTYVATRPTAVPAPTIINVESHVIQCRVSQAVYRSRRVALADARKCMQHMVNKLGDDECM